MLSVWAVWADWIRFHSNRGVNRQKFWFVICNFTSLSSKLQIKACVQKSTLFWYKNNCAWKVLLAICADQIRETTMNVANGETRKPCDLPTALKSKSNGKNEFRSSFKNKDVLLNPMNLSLEDGMMVNKPKRARIACLISADILSKCNTVTNFKQSGENKSKFLPHELYVYDTCVKTPPKRTPTYD